MSTTLPSGSMFAAYTIEGVVARGGMGVVYRATQLQPRRRIALKLIAPEHAGEAAYRERFLRETDLLASLEHPNIVPIHAAGEWEGQLYLAMRYIDGPDLGTFLVREGPLSLPRTTDILSHVADALDAAHDEGLVHRDIKPANILLSEKGAVYLTDFGLTKRAASDSGLTKPGQAIGTAGYMAPEQFTGSADPTLASRIDIYALGCVLHACLTGVEPYPRDSYEQALFAHVYSPPPTVSDRRPDLPREVDDVLARALAKDASSRYSRAGELVDALRATLHIQPQPNARLDGPTVALPDRTGAVPPPPSQRRRLTPPPESSGAARVESMSPPAVPLVGQLPTQAATPPAVALPPGGGGPAKPPGGVTRERPFPRRGPSRAVLIGIMVILAIVAVVAFLMATDLLHIGPQAHLGHESASPAASIAASAVIASHSEHPGATATPTTSPTASSGGGVEYGSAADVAGLLQKVPSEVRSSCVSDPKTGRAIATVQCELPAGNLVWYDSYANLDDLRADIELARTTGGVPTTATDCTQGLDCVTPWSWDGVGATQGTAVIWTFEKTPFLEYTYEDALVKVTHVGVETDRPALYTQWVNAPPLPKANP